jgi:hypothetical protein
MHRTLTGLAVVATLLGLASAVGVPARADAPAGGGTGGTFATIPPYRAVSAVGTPGGSTVHVPVLGLGGVPASGVSAVSITLTVAATTKSGFLTAWADGTTRPVASNLNFAAGQDIANSAAVSVGANGKIAVYNGAAGSVRVIVDVIGYYRSGAPTEAGSLTPTTPVRKLDTRTGQGGSRPGANGTVSVNVGVPNASVLMNLTAVVPQKAGHLTAYAHGTSLPATSTLNFVANQTIANQVIVPVGASGVVDIQNASAGATDVLADVVGTFQPGSASVPGAFGAVSPARVLDTRVAGSGGPIASETQRVVPVGGRAGVPASGVAAVVVNVTVTHVTQAGNAYLDAYAYPTDHSHGTSRLNYVAGRNMADLMTVPTTTDGSITLYSKYQADVVVDVVGYVLDGTGASYGGLTGRAYVPPQDAYEGLASVQVSVYAGAQLVASTTTDDLGDYAIAAAPTSADGYAVCFAPPSGYAAQCYSKHPWSSGTTPPAGADHLAVRNADVSRGVDVLLQPAGTGTITGTLTAADTSAPYSGAGVSVYPASGDQSRPVAQGGTDDNGNYEVVDLPIGTQYVVCFTTTELQYQDACYHDAADAAHGTPVAVTDGGYTNGIDQVLPGGGPTSKLTGYITSAANGRAVVNTTVTLWNAAHTKTLESLYASDSDGSYDLSGVPTGSYQVCVDGSFGRQGEAAGTGYGSQCSALDVTAPTTTAGPNFALPVGGLITGTIKATNGHTLGDAHVIAYSGGAAVRRIDSDSSGTYRLAGLPNGSYTVCVDGAEANYPVGGDFGPTGFSDQCWQAVTWNGSTPLPAGTTPVAVTAGTTKSGINATLQKTP